MKAKMAPKLAVITISFSFYGVENSSAAFLTNEKVDVTFEGLSRLLAEILMFDHKLKMAAWIVADIILF